MNKHQMTFWDVPDKYKLVRQLPKNFVFVFGSNPEGRHGKGAALAAKQLFGAKYGVGHGLVGNSYARITKNLRPHYMCAQTGVYFEKAGHNSVSLEQITKFVAELYATASANPEKTFIVPYISGSTTLNGYSTDKLICTCFLSTHWPPANVWLHSSMTTWINQLLVQCNTQPLTTAYDLGW